MTPAQLKKSMLDDLLRSGLSEADARKLQLSTTPHVLLPKTPAYTIPYFDSKGRKTKFYRIRYLGTTLKGFDLLSGRKPLRYNQPLASINEVYMPPFIDWHTYLRGSDPLIITEGEKKSAIATKMGLPTLGLGGVWCFMSKRAGALMLPIFEELNCKDRAIYICFDSDAATNPDILLAEATLAKRLVEKGATVFIARIPHGKHKVGIDDYMLHHDATKFQRNILSKAFEYAPSKALHEMNQEFVYIRSIGAVHDYKHSMRHLPYAFVNHQYSNKFIVTQAIDKDGKQKLVRANAAKTWMEWEHRAELLGITYAPGKPEIFEGQLNTWSGWGVTKAQRGDVSLWHRLLDHLFGDDKESRQWFERWCAYPIQHPGYKMATAVVMWGVNTGTGKTLCGHTLMRLYGRNATEVKDSDLEDTRFAWAENKQFVLADDITGHNSRKLANIFKTIITQKTIRINQKYIPSYTIADTINYYFTSNDPDAFYLDNMDRRFLVWEVLCSALPEELRRPFVEWRDSDAGIEALFYYMLNLPLGDFDPQAAAPLTEAKRDMIHIGKSELGVWVDKLRTSPDSILNGKMRGDLFTAEALHMLYDPLGVKRASSNALARELKRSGFYKLQYQSGRALNVNGRQLRLYAIRNSEKWRTAKLNEAIQHYTENTQPLKEKF